jgi:hypothetical protein
MLGLGVSAILFLIAALLLYALSAGPNPGVGIRGAILLNGAFIASFVGFLPCIAVSVAQLAGSDRLAVIARSFAIGAAFAGVFITIALVAIHAFAAPLHFVENGWHRSETLFMPSLLVSLFVGVASGLLLMRRRVFNKGS